MILIRWDMEVKGLGMKLMWFRNLLAAMNTFTAIDAFDLLRWDEMADSWISLRFSIFAMIIG